MVGTSGARIEKSIGHRAQDLSPVLITCHGSRPMWAWMRSKQKGLRYRSQLVISPVARANR
jgi:hypothetical protein